MSEENSRTSRSGDYDYSKYNKVLPENQGSHNRRSNTPSGERTTNSSSRYSGTSTYADSHERQSSFLSPSRGHQVDREKNYGSHHSHPGRNSSQRSHQLPFHKGFNTSHASGPVCRDFFYEHQPDQCGTYPLKDDFAGNGTRGNNFQSDRSKEWSTQSEQHRGSQMQRHPNNFNNSSSLSYNSSEAKRHNFPPGHPNHNPHLPPPNPFSQPPPSFNATQRPSKPDEKSSKTDGGRIKKANEGHGNNRYHKESSHSTYRSSNVTSFYGTFCRIIKDKSFVYFTILNLFIFYKVFFLKKFLFYYISIGEVNFQKSDRRSFQVEDRSGLSKRDYEQDKPSLSTKKDVSEENESLDKKSTPNSCSSTNAKSTDRVK